METKTSTENTSSSILLTGVVFLARLNFVGLMDYAQKSGIGGEIWIGYKLTADYIDKKRKSKP